MKMAMVTALSVLAGMAFAAGAASAAVRALDKNNNAVSVPFVQSPASGWSIMARGTTSIEGRQMTGVTAVSPPYDSVQLGRISGNRVVVCQSVVRPWVEDNGVSRVWVYRGLRPTSGGCVGSALSGYVALGYKGATRSTTNQVP